MINKELAIKKITQMPEEQVLKLLIFMAGMEAERIVKDSNENNELINTKQSN